MQTFSRLAAFLVGAGAMLGAPSAHAQLAINATFGASLTPGPLTGAIFTTNHDGTRVNGNIYADCCDVYLNGGPPPNAPCSAAGLPCDPDTGTDYYFMVTDPSGAVLLSNDAICRRRVRVTVPPGSDPSRSSGFITQYLTDVDDGGCGPSRPCDHEVGIGKCGAPNIGVQLMPFDPTPNAGGVYKAWMTRANDYDASGSSGPDRTFGFVHSLSKTDNFKCLRGGEGACCVQGPPSECRVGLTQQQCDALGGCFYGAGSTSCDATASCTQCGAPLIGSVSLFKYYDTNANGSFDLGTDPPLDGFRIRLHVFDANNQEVFPDASTPPTIAPDIWVTGLASPGTVRVNFDALHPFPYTFTACEILPGTGGSGHWMQTEPAPGACVNGTIPSPGSDVTARFGNVCLGEPDGGLTLGFWSNRNGQRVLTNCTGGLAANMTFLGGLCLRNADGTDFDPANYSNYRSWLLSANATNMAYMLSAQLTAMEFNVREAGCLGGYGGGVGSGSIILAPGTNCANPLGFATVGCVINEANNELCAHGQTLSGSQFRAYQEALKIAIDQANNNENFVSSSPCPVVYP